METFNFDKQFISREGKCHDCVVKEETLMVCEGYSKKEPLYEQWERNKIRKNAESFLLDAAKDVEMLKAKFTKNETHRRNNVIKNLFLKIVKSFL